MSDGQLSGQSERTPGPIAHVFPDADLGLSATELCSISLLLVVGGSGHPYPSMTRITDR